MRKARTAFHAVLTWFLLAQGAHGTGLEVAAIGAAWTALGAVGQAIVINVAVFAVATVAQYGLSFLVSRPGQQQQRAQADQSASSSFNVELPEFSGLARRRRAYGQVDTIGAVFFHKTVAVGGSAPNHWIFGLLVSEGVCNRLVALIINGKVCQLDAFGNPQTEPWYNPGGNKLKASFRSGTDDQAMDPIIAARFPTPPDDFYEDLESAERIARWAEFRQRGICTVVLDLTVGADANEQAELWGTGGVPELKLRLEGLLLFDRDNPLHDADDPTTWAYSDIATVAIEDIACAEIGAQVPRADMDHAQNRESIRIDKEWVPTLSGQERRGRVNGVVTSDEDPIDMISSMLQMNRGALRIGDGKVSIRADRPATPVATIQKLQWDGALETQNQPDVRSLMTGVVAEYFPPDRFGEPAETYYPATAWDDVEATRVTFRFGNSSPQAQRLAYQMKAENGEARTISGPFKSSVLHAPGKSNRLLEDGDCILFDAPAPYDDMNGLYTVADIQIRSDFVVILSLVGTSPTGITGWSTALEIAA